ncbi:MAG: DUF3052 domain-containing protein [Cyclobacteriaceae bacterium]
MTAGYSKTPLVKKLGIKEGFRIEIVNPPEDYDKLIGEYPDGVEKVSQGTDLDFVHIFTNSFGELESLMINYKDRIKKNGTIWFSWYKKASKLPSEITEDYVRNTALSLGLVDVKVCAVDEKWSGLKIVIRKENR